jgi:hypothetical protein
MVCAGLLVVLGVPAFSEEQALVMMAAATRTRPNAIENPNEDRLRNETRKLRDRVLSRGNITPPSKRIWGTSTLRVLLHDSKRQHFDYIDNLRPLDRRDTEVHQNVLLAVESTRVMGNRLRR